MAFDGNILSVAEIATFTSGTFIDSFTISGADVDMVRIELVAGNTYQIDEDNLGSGDAFLRIFDVFGNEVRAVDDGAFGSDDVVLGQSPYAVFMPNYSGTYYVALSSTYLRDYDPTTTAGRILPENPSATFSGDLRITDLGSNLTFPGANAIGPSGLTAEGVNDETDVFREDDGSLRVQYAGVMEFTQDVDVGRIDLAKGDWIVVDVNGLEGNGTVLRIFTSAGTQIGFDSGTGTANDAELTFIAPTTGTFNVAISGTGNTAYNIVDGTGTAAGAIGAYEVIVHRNPTQVGTSIPNAFTGSAADNYIVSLSANDTINGNDGNDTLAGGDDQDSISGGRGLDVLYGEHGNDTLRGDDGSDVLSGSVGDDFLDGGKGADSLSGGVGNDSLLGGGGNAGDTLNGENGADTLDGGGGNDSLGGGLGNDSMIGGRGNDTMLGSSDSDTLLGGAGDDSLNGEFGDDSLAADSGNDFLLGGAGNDTLDGGADNDSMFGSTNDDLMLGGRGADSMDGGVDNDSLSGGDDNDTLGGNTGNDTLNGGQGADAFVFLSTVGGVDVVEDFTLASDRIDLSDIFAATGSVVTGANLALFVQVTPAGAGADTFLAIDANGSIGGLSFTIVAQVTGVTTTELFDFANFIV